ncbi:MAG: hypothetical protein QGH60_22075 [Phycisphaerae bacterium]|jgi:hypothetical protein|nr:hypothetical protein [Phycisphaerae bacterium]
MIEKPKQLHVLTLVVGWGMVVLSAFLCGCDSRNNDDPGADDVADDKPDVVHSEYRRRKETIESAKKVAAGESDHTEISRNKAGATPATRRKPETPTASRGRTDQRDRDDRANRQDVAESMEDTVPVREARALVARLENEQGKARRQAAVALSGAVRKVENKAALAEWISPLIEAKLQDTDVTVREYAGRALMSVLQGVNDQWALQPAVEALIDTLDSGSATLKQRQYAAVALSVAVRKIKNEAFLESILQPLVMATTKDPDKGVREYAGRAFLSALKKVDDEAVLEPALGPLVETLGHKEVKMHRYAAWALANLVPKIRKEATLKQIIAPLTNAGVNGRHRHVREYCRRALKSIQARLKPPAATGPKE